MSVARGGVFMIDILLLWIGRVKKALAAMALVFSLACGTASAQTAPDAAASQGAEAPAQTSIKLVGVIAALPAGSRWLSIGNGTLCLTEATQVWTGGRAAQELSPYTDAFKTQLEQAGYKVVTPGVDNLFDAEAGAA